jgi:hypothetical protein
MGFWSRAEKGGTLNLARYRRRVKAKRKRGKKRAREAERLRRMIEEGI